MNNFKSLHPICIFTYFVFMIVMQLLCNHPIFIVIACAGAISLLLSVGVKELFGMFKWILPMTVFIAVANPLLNHRGVTRLCRIFGQWITLEAVCYGIVAAMLLATLILWFSSYQKIMTSDKFLYLFGKIAPATSLLITMALASVPKLRGQLQQIRECQEMETGKPEKTGDKFRKATNHVTTLIGWSLENAVEQADSMKARGYGIKRRTTFHLFHFRKRDIRFFSLLLVGAGICLGLRMQGCGKMDFYPRINGGFLGQEDIFFYVVFGVIAGLPGAMEWKEKLLWRSYNLNL